MSLQVSGWGRPLLLWSVRDNICFEVSWYNYLLLKCESGILTNYFLRYSILKNELPQLNRCFPLISLWLPDASWIPLVQMMRRNQREIKGKHRFGDKSFSKCCISGTNLSFSLILIYMKDKCTKIPQIFCCSNRIIKKVASPRQRNLSQKPVMTSLTAAVNCVP